MPMRCSGRSIAPAEGRRPRAPVKGSVGHWPAGAGVRVWSPLPPGSPKGPGERCGKRKRSHPCAGQRGVLWFY